MGGKGKYPQPHSLKMFSPWVRDQVHNAIKHGECIKKYKIFLKPDFLVPMRKRSNGHKTRSYVSG